jgi:hypothetical protein
MRVAAGTTILERGERVTPATLAQLLAHDRLARDEEALVDDPARLIEVREPQLPRPPVGPAIPVIETDQSALISLLTPCAIALAVGSLTCPIACMVVIFTPKK